MVRVAGSKGILVPKTLPRMEWKLEDFDRLSFVEFVNKTPISQGVIEIYRF